jgi:hypothetical protein
MPPKDCQRELLRILLSRTRANKGDIEKNRSNWRLRSCDLRTSELSEARFLVHAGVGLTIPGGLASPDSAAPSSSCCCFLRFRDKCSGPAQMTTTIAATTISPQ